VRTKIRLGVAAFVIVWTILFHAQSHWNPILAYPLYPGNMVHLLVTGPRRNSLTGEDWVCSRVGDKPLSLFGGDIHFAASGPIFKVN